MVCARQGALNWRFKSPTGPARASIARWSLKEVQTGRRWVVDMDLEKFFDHVSHDVLMARVRRKVKEKRVLRLIRSYRQAGMMTDGLVESPRRRGTP